MSTWARTARIAWASAARNWRRSGRTGEAGWCPRIPLASGSLSRPATCTPTSGNRADQFRSRRSMGSNLYPAKG